MSVPLPTSSDANVETVLERLDAGLASVIGTSDEVFCVAVSRKVLESLVEVTRFLLFPTWFHTQFDPARHVVPGDSQHSAAAVSSLKGEQPEARSERSTSDPTAALLRAQRQQALRFFVHTLTEQLTGAYLCEAHERLIRDSRRDAGGSSDAKNDAAPVSPAAPALDAGCPRAIDERVASVVSGAVAFLPKLQGLLLEDCGAALAADVAAMSYMEVMLSYPGLHCLTYQRLAHHLHTAGAPLLITRTLTEIAHTLTGIDIHPGARIGRRCFIDHGAGVVIGGTAIVGDDVVLFQGVTLGAKSFPKDSAGQPIKGLPRHPIVENGVTLYAHAIVLGRVTVGAGATIGGGAWVTSNVPAKAFVRNDGTKLVKEEKELFSVKAFEFMGGAGI